MVKSQECLCLPAVSWLNARVFAPAGLSPRGESPEEAVIEGCACIYRMYLQSVYTVCIPDKISIGSNRGRMESLGNDDVSSLNACMESLDNDDVSLKSVRRYLVGK